jgi:hypothetical protein
MPATRGGERHQRRCGWILASRTPSGIDGRVGGDVDGNKVAAVHAQEMEASSVHERAGGRAPDAIVVGRGRA